MEHDSKEVANAVMGLLWAGAKDRTESRAAFLEELKEPPKSRTSTGVRLGKSKSSVNWQRNRADIDADEAKADSRKH